MKPDFDKMTLDELRDWVAREDGWNIYTASNGIDVWERGGFAPELYEHQYEQAPSHPYPNTLDAADAAMPEGWVWRRSDGSWRGWRTMWETNEETPDTGNKVRDLFCLACKCRWAEREAQQ